MDGKKANLTGDTRAGILKGCVDSYISVLTKILNTSLEKGCFPNQLKGCLLYKNIFRHKIALDVQLMNFFI